MPVIIIGTTNLRRKRDQGDFRCPECRCQRQYALKSVRPFLTLYWIPVVPIGRVQHYVECDKCGEVFGTPILDVDEAAALQVEQRQFQHEVLNAAVLSVVADGEITEDEIATLGHVATMVTGEQMDREELGSLCGSAGQVGFKAQNYLRSVAFRWDREQKIFAMQAIFLATSAGGDLRPDQLEGLVEIRKVLGLSRTDFENAVESALTLAEDWS